MVLVVMENRIVGGLAYDLDESTDNARSRNRVDKITKCGKLKSYVCRGVAQPGSAPALGAGGLRFESGRPDQYVLCLTTCASQPPSALNDLYFRRSTRRSLLRVSELLTVVQRKSSLSRSHLRVRQSGSARESAS